MTGKPKRQRLSPKDREQMIVAAAIRIFADGGFGIPARELARRIGITHPLLYRYFPTKEHLIARIYRTLIVDRWRPEWQVLLADRSRPLAERLSRFYVDYADAIFSYEGMRIFFYMSLKGENLQEPYLRGAYSRLFHSICEELRADAGLPDSRIIPLSQDEIELAWGLHGSILYLGVREFVFRMAPQIDRTLLIDRQVRVFADGVRNQLRGIVAAQNASDVAPLARVRRRATR